MSLFQSIVIEKYVQELDPKKLEQAWQSYSDYFLNAAIQDNIRISKEEQYQEGFLRDLFVTVLGYTLNPNPDYDLTTEFKNQVGSKKADGAILKDGHAIGVIELKGMNTTDLSKIEPQAFGYKNNQPKCRYVITSNFQKLRLYIDNAVEFIEFNLFTLSQADFAQLYLLLNRDSILSDLPVTIKSASLSQEEAITKQLYKDYSVFKRELFDDLTTHNPSIDNLVLFQKSQKLLDRLLFIFFAEDSHLLPANFAKGIISEWEQLKSLKMTVPLYDRIKAYFGYLDKGHKDEHSEIFAYNGGLFSPDALLDSVIISDDILFRHIKILSEYDFDSEVDVNILGHIFENSLTELDEVKAQLAGEAVDKSQTKRKKDGVFYTPKYITKYIVENTVGKLCEDKKSELAINDEDYQQDVTINKDGTKKKKSAKQLAIETQALERLHAYRDWLLQITICDPACGSGAFLNEALNFLIAEHEYIVELETKLFGSGLPYADIENSILENNLFGVDINEESVEIAKLSLWLRTAQPRRKLNNLNDNIQCGNSLIDDPAVAGDKAFNWQTAFPQVFAKGGFDVVIGNPPYLRVQGIKDTQKEQSDFYENSYDTAKGRYDLYMLFIELSLRIIKKSGKTCLILPHNFINSNSGKSLRKMMVSKKVLESILHFGSNLVFNDASTYTCILTLSNDNTIMRYAEVEPINIFEPINYSKINMVDLTKDKWILNSPKIQNIFTKLSVSGQSLGDVCKNISRGVVTGYDGAFVLSGKKTGKVFHGYSKALDKSISIESDLVKPILMGSSFSRYSRLEEDLYILYPHKVDSNRTIPISKEDLQKVYPKTYEYLLEFEKDLTKKKIKYKTNPEFWYSLHNSRDMSIFETEKILTPYLCYKSQMTLDNESFYSNDKCSSIILKNEFKEYYKFFLSLLNSQLFWFYITRTSSEFSGGYYAYTNLFLEPFPLPKIPSDVQQFTEKADLMLSLNEQLQDLTGKFLRTLQRKFEIEKLSKKLENWHELSYKEFIKELSKKKIKMSLSDEAEWEEYFLAEQDKAQELIAEIERTDSEIDQMVYKLYDLTDDEIATIEAS